MVNGFKKKPDCAFTFIEITMTIAIIAILCMISYPAATHYVSKTKEAALKKDLFVMRESIDKFYAVYNRYPASLDELVEKKFIRAVPIDPVTSSYDGWIIIPSKEGERDVFNVKSGAPGTDSGNTAYENY
jgi:general secretion pathway protein G